MKQFFIENMQYILIGVLFIISCVNTILYIISNKRVKQYKKLYDKTLSKFNSKKNIEDDFETIYERLNEVEKISKETMEEVDKFRNKMKSNVQKIGFVKYNAYDETENKLSFSLALLDEYNNGVLINHIYSKHGSNVYAKLVTESKVEDRISEEEEAALKMAIDDKDFKLRVVGETVKSKKKRIKN